jgi:hypothetical protein
MKKQSPLKEMTVLKLALVENKKKGSARPIDCRYLTTE